MRFLIHSNAPHIPTGYGVQTKYLADMLTLAGHDVAVSCTYGHQGPIGSWTTPHGHEVRLYPSGYITSSADILYAHAQHWFDGDPSAGYVIVLSDLWSLADRRWGLDDWNVIGWCPVDHDPVPPGVLSFFELTGATPLLMSRFGQVQFERVGIGHDYAPLAVDTEVFKPTFELPTSSGDTFSARQLFGLPHQAFVVGMVAMNKDPGDRKGFNEAFRAFARFHAQHPEAILFLHTEPDSAGGGLSLRRMIAAAGIPEHAVVFSHTYAYRLGMASNMMAAAYTAMDVLLACSRGEGFCVPLIEAQACGTPVIVSNFTAQPELVGVGWLVDGQIEWDPAQDSNYFRAYVPSIVERLNEAHGSDLDAMQAQAQEFAAQYDYRTVFDKHWVPFLASLDHVPADDKPPMERVAVIVPGKRPEMWPALVESFDESNDGTATLYLIVDDGEPVLVEGCTVMASDRGETFAQKANVGYLNTDEDWLFVCGEDCRFTPGWLDKPRELSTRFDVIGTNDAAEGETKNPDVAAGRHADHWFTRRSYIDEVGSSLEGPGVFCPEVYFHWWTDREVIELARARRVFTPCLESHVIHEHPGYDGDEAAREADPVYMKAVEWSERDFTQWKRRLPLIEQHRVTRR